MPELPEVELSRRALVGWFRGRTLIRGEADASRVFRGSRRTAFERLQGRLESAERRGKYLVLRFSSGASALTHFGMTGKLVRSRRGELVKFSRARFILDSGDVIHFADPRMFGRIEVLGESGLAKVAAFASLGIDPLVDGLTPESLRGAIGPSKQPLKVALMDQERIAGLGNLWTNEALFLAKLHPARKPGSLTAAEWNQLQRAIESVIAEGLDAPNSNADEIAFAEDAGDAGRFWVYDRAGEACAVCDARVKRIALGGRSSFYCPHCQPARRTVTKSKVRAIRKVASPPSKRSSHRKRGAK